MSATRLPVRMSRRRCAPSDLFCCAAPLQRLHAALKFFRMLAHVVYPFVYPLCTNREASGEAARSRVRAMRALETCGGIYGPKSVSCLHLPSD